MGRGIEGDYPLTSDLHGLGDSRLANIDSLWLCTETTEKLVDSRRLYEAACVTLRVLHTRSTSTRGGLVRADLP
jgi:hypothetical protein